MHIFEPKKRLAYKNYTKKTKCSNSSQKVTWHYSKKNYVKIRNCINSSQKKRKTPNSTLKKLCQEKKMQKFELKKHQTLPYKNYAKKKKMQNSSQ